MNMWTIYLLLKLDVFCTMFEIFSVVLGMGSLLIGFIIIVAIGGMPESVKNGFFNCLKIAIPSFLFFLFLHTITPTTKQMCAIYVIPKIANNEKIQNIGDKSLTLIEKKFEEWVNDTIGTQEKETK